MKIYANKIVKLLISYLIVASLVATMCIDAFAQTEYTLALADGTYNTISSSNTRRYTVVQGGCRNDYYYFCGMAQGTSTDDTCWMASYYPNGTLRTSALRSMGHCNDMTYDSLNRYITVVKRYEYSEDAGKLVNTNKVECMNINFEHRNTFYLNEFSHMFGIAFDSSANQYYVCGATSETTVKCVVYTSWFKPVRSFTYTKDVNKNETNQGIEYYNNCIYAFQCNSSNTEAYISVYLASDTDNVKAGTLLHKYTIDTQNGTTSYEAENISIKSDNVLTLGLNRNSSSTDRVCSFSFYKGDVNLDDQINGKDVLMLMKAVKGLVTDIHYLNADVDENGVVNDDDVTKLKEMIVGLASVDVTIETENIETPNDIITSKQ